MNTYTVKKRTFKPETPDPLATPIPSKNFKFLTWKPEWIVFGKNLSWEEAKQMRKINKGSEIFKEHNEPI